MIGILGEALIDFISVKGIDDADCFQSHCGGCALNAATAASRLGSSVLYIGKLSADMFGQQMRQHFIENNVRLNESLCGCAANSMIGFAKLDAHGAASYVFYSEGTTPTVLDAHEIAAVFASEPNLNFLHIGSVALALKQSGEEILKALSSLQNLPFIFLDPNVRPTVIADFAAYRSRLLAVASLSDIIKLSDEDLHFLYPEIPERRAIDDLLSKGAAHVVLTRGKHGMDWYAASGYACAETAIDVPIVDTVGAGDTVSGAILSYLEGKGLKDSSRITLSQAKEALHFASAAAAVTCSRKGCDPPTRSEVVI